MTEQGRFSCAICGANYRYLQGLRRHEGTIHGNVRFECSECCGRWIRRESASKHIETALGRCGRARVLRVEGEPLDTKEEEKVPSTPASPAHDGARVSATKSKPDEDYDAPASKKVKVKSLVVRPTRPTSGDGTVTSSTGSKSGLAKKIPTHSLDTPHDNLLPKMFMRVKPRATVFLEASTNTDPPKMEDKVTQYNCPQGTLYLKQVFSQALTYVAGLEELGFHLSFNEDMDGSPAPLAPVPPAEPEAPADEPPTEQEVPVVNPPESDPSRGDQVVEPATGPTEVDPPAQAAPTLVQAVAPLAPASKEVKVESKEKGACKANPIVIGVEEEVVDMPNAKDPNVSSSSSDSNSSSSGTSSSSSSGTSSSSSSRSSSSGPDYGLAPPHKLVCSPIKRIGSPVQLVPESAVPKDKRVVELYFGQDEQSTEAWDEEDIVDLFGGALEDSLSDKEDAPSIATTASFSPALSQERWSKPTMHSTPKKRAKRR